MKRAVKVAWNLSAPMTLTILSFFFLIGPARAPSGGKLWSGGRTIASLQEADFDRRLLKLQLCYGVRVVADQCTIERRRVCKALVVHELEGELDQPGKNLHSPVEFHCEDTSVGKALVDEDGSVRLRPNAEISSIHGVLAANLGQSTPNPLQHLEAREACEFLTDCKWAMRPQSLSLRKLGSCLTTGNATHRKILMNEVAAMLFGGKTGRRNSLYPYLVKADGK